MKKVIFALVMLFTVTQNVFADDTHSHEAAVEPAPHGGTLRDAGDFKAEAVLKGDTVTIYIFDKKLKPVKLEKEQLVGEVQFPKQEKKKVTFKKIGETYQATIAGIGKVHRYDLHFELEIQGKKSKVDFGIDNI